jgi:hypothetical protein
VFTARLKFVVSHTYQVPATLNENRISSEFRARSTSKGARLDWVLSRADTRLRAGLVPPLVVVVIQAVMVIGLELLGAMLPMVTWSSTPSKVSAPPSWPATHGDAGKLTRVPFLLLPDQSAAVVPLASLNAQRAQGQAGHDEPQSTPVSEPLFTPSVQLPHEAPVTSQPLAAVPSQSSLPAGQAVQLLLVQVWPVVHAATGQLVPQLESVVVIASQAFVGELSQSRVPAPQATQFPPEQYWVFVVQGVSEPHDPADEHVCVELPEHCFALGTHVPVQVAFTHADATHGLSLPHTPDAEQVWMLLFEHCFVVGMQEPTHAPLTQA